MDRIKLLHVRGVLHACQGHWLEAEQDLQELFSPLELFVSGTPLLKTWDSAFNVNEVGREICKGL